MKPLLNSWGRKLSVQRLVRLVVPGRATLPSLAAVALIAVAVGSGCSRQEPTAEQAAGQTPEETDTAEVPRSTGGAESNNAPAIGGGEGWDGESAQSETPSNPPAPEDAEESSPFPDEPAELSEPHTSENGAVASADETVVDEAVPEEPEATRPPSEPSRGEGASAQSGSTSAVSDAQQFRQKHLRSRPRTADTLYKWAEWCYRKGLYLESEECLRAALLVEPEMKTARRAYDDLGKKSKQLERTVVAAYPYAREAKAGRAPSGRQLFVLPLDVNLDLMGDKYVSLDSQTLQAKAGTASAELVAMAVAGAYWEKAVIRRERDGSVVSLCRDAVSFGPQGVKKKRDAKPATKPYHGPCTAVFSVPRGQRLTELRYQGEPPMPLSTKEVGALSELVFDPSADLHNRLAAVTALSAAPPPYALRLLDRIVAGEQAELAAAARAVARPLHRRLNVVQGAYGPVRENKNRYLLAAVLSDGRHERRDTQPTSPTSRPSRYGEMMMPSPMMSGYGIAESASGATELRVTWDFDQAGRYFSRLMVFDPGADLRCVDYHEVLLDVPKPGIYLCELELGKRRCSAIGEDSMEYGGEMGMGYDDEDDDYVGPGMSAGPHAVRGGSVKLVELWSGDQLMERKVLADDDLEMAVVEAKTPILTPPEPESADKPVRKAPAGEPGERYEEMMPGMMAMPGGDMYGYDGAEEMSYGPLSSEEFGSEMGMAGHYGGMGFGAAAGFPADLYRDQRPTGPGSTALALMFDEAPPEEARLTPLLEAPDSRLPSLQRVARWALRRSAQTADDEKMRTLVAAITRLEESGSPVVTERAVDEIEELLGNGAAELCERIAMNTKEPLSVFMVRRLGCLALESPEACASLIRLRNSREASPMRQSAEAVLAELAAAGVIAQAHGFWQYHGVVHDR